MSWSDIFLPARAISAILGLLLCAMSSSAATVSLVWSPSPDTNVVGYNIYYGPSSRTYTNKLDVGNALTATVSNLVAGTTYYFTATACNSLGMESDYSNEAACSVPPLPPSNLHVVTVVSGIESSPGAESPAWSVQCLFTNAVTVTNPVGTAFYRAFLKPVQIR